MALDTTSITDAALDLLREEGVDGVTFRKLTARLGVKAPAIYWRFASKQELLEAMGEAILSGPLGDLAPHEGPEPWREWFASRLQRLRTAMLAYPDGARVVTGARPLRTPTLGYLSEYALRAAESAGEDPAQAATAIYTALHFTFGRVIEEQDSTGAATMDEATQADFAARFPTVARLIARLGDVPDPAQATFDAGLTLILRLP
ncbi:MAG: TetR family transcriptional regulator [Hamadaea sp.]|uniref:TetR family transcriptional regulator n=1 Tax=Hamadaea sp. TaxID=2024425 RepID=UPI0018205D72|nr:TetR family transcriptional regulator [Hamadaea sp.]NUR72820.1 TetR family transcriptional regulator [Hamadaea sp.]NUT20465.1 TetR family transcriptional regulator [Hamadaea sp.]